MEERPEELCGYPGKRQTLNFQSLPLQRAVCTRPPQPTSRPVTLSFTEVSDSSLHSVLPSMTPSGCEVSHPGGQTMLRGYTRTVGGGRAVAACLWMGGKVV